jgi:four helix bundle protein
MQNEKCKVKSERQDLSERLLSFAADVIKFTVTLNRTAPGRHIASSIDALLNIIRSKYEEACGAESKADFTHKMQLVLKELKESLYWLKLIRKSALIINERVEPLLIESQELTKIIAKSIVTARSG